MYTKRFYCISFRRYKRQKYQILSNPYNLFPAVSAWTCLLFRFVPLACHSVRSPATDPNTVQINCTYNRIRSTVYANNFWKSLGVSGKEPIEQYWSVGMINLSWVLTIAGRAGTESRTLQQPQKHFHYKMQPTSRAHYDAPVLCWSTPRTKCTARRCLLFVVCLQTDRRIILWLRWKISPQPSSKAIIASHFARYI